MRPYVVRQGDYLGLLAYKFGFDADTVWNDPANQDLQQSRSDPNLLLPTDMLQIPDPPDQADGFSLKVGQTNSFVSDVPTVEIHLVFADSERASQAFTIPELPDLTGKSTGGDGTATFDVPISMQTFSVVFSSDGATYPIKVGHLDPVDEFTGVVQRLQNLGFLSPDGDMEDFDVDAVVAALGALQASQTGDDSGQDYADERVESPDSDDGSGDGDALCDPPFDADGEGDVTKYDDEDSDGGDADGGDDDDGDNDGDDDDEGGGDDDAQDGDDAPDAPALDDDGNPNDQAKKLLVDAHGS
jgi:hypothetical protein